MPTPRVVSRIRSIIDSPGFREHQSQQIVASIGRLVDHQDIRPIWEAMERDRDPYLPELFFDACVAALQQWQRLPGIPGGEIAANLSRLAAEATSLADNLDQHASEIAFFGVSLVVEEYSGHLSAKQPANSHQRDQSRIVSSPLREESRRQRARVGETPH